ncbi:diguanylate cyclase [Chloroherpeton thalassium ATCC 35110]|uniref:diguanylate cyclase n=1 Tax=Chloroherpeton thalassium (strain ATCC 35110 / GB-78) TaxID=517418 RepID=B3QWQ6_CHLT3|nr:GGDEF domain-containing protein [Chloroherpeton thalassium]ACF13270.1 diguanylate cyclase [Chloroherpeton thalassium ATCC 35110]
MNEQADILLKKTSFFVFVVFSMVVSIFALTSPVDPEFSTVDLVGKSLTLFFVGFWIYIIQRSTASQRVYVNLFIGFSLYFIGALEDIFEEVLEVSDVLDLIEDYGMPLGMFFISIGLFYWQKEMSEANEMLRKDKELLNKLNNIDKLSGLYNSAYLQTQLEKEVDRAKRYHRRFSIMLIDIDAFNEYVETYGQLESERLIASFAENIKQNIRRTDIACRYGTGDFAVILPETEKMAAMHLAERVRKSLSVQALQPEKSFGLTIYKTVSIGVASFLSDEKAAALLARAEKAMRFAKQSGKNKVYTFKTDSVVSPS